MVFARIARIALVGVLLAVSPVALAVPAVSFPGGNGPYDLGNSPLGVASPVILILLQNTGDTALTITSVLASGDFTSPTTPIACSVVVTVPAGGSCTIFAQFIPTALGTRNGTITVTSNAPGSPHTITLTGFGIIAAAYIASPLQLTFSAQAVGTTSPPQIVTVNNPGTVTSLSTADFTTTGDFAQTNNCGASIAPLSSCQVSVTFTPTALGLRTGTLELCNDCNFVTTTVNLQGSVGAAAPLAPIPTLSQWAIAALAGLLTIVAMLRLRRRG